MKSVFLILALVFLCACCMGAGYVFGGSNLGYSGYPEFNNSKPYQPHDRDKYSASIYQNDVEAYIRAAKDYIENAENDQKRINNAIEEAIEEANQVVNDYNDWVRGW